MGQELNENTQTGCESCNVDRAVESRGGRQAGVANQQAVKGYRDECNVKSTTPLFQRAILERERNVGMRHA
eukprot:3282437-Pleurochrysis_carterae.AAC.3